MHQDREREQWERTRAICYNVAKFGNSDPKKFPKTIQKFWPFPWDKKAPGTDARAIMEHDAKMRQLREEVIKKQQHGR